MNKALATAGAMVLVFVVFNATVGRLMRSNLADVEAQLGPSPSTIELRSADLCTMLAGEGWRRSLQSVLLPWPTVKANTLRARWHFVAEPSETEVTCGKHVARHVLHVTPR